MKTRLRSPFSKQKGLSPVELMVTMTISVVILTGVIQMLLSSTKSYNTQDSLKQLRHTSQTSLALLEKHIRMAGAPNMELTTINGSKMYAPAQNAINGNNGSGKQPDTITISYYSNKDACGGNQTGDARYTFSIKNKGNINYLTCNNAISDFFILKHVENMQIRYGIDGDLTRPARIATYYSNSPANNSRIVSIQVALLIKSQQRISEKCEASHTLLDNSISTNDCFIYKTIGTTIKLRNRPVAS